MGPVLGYTKSQKGNKDAEKQKNTNEMRKGRLLKPLQSLDFI